nr:TetR/AcrR family transcriptional regulator C-terminal domain-containing protein [uncultured Eisenbergiella sp.]
MEPVKTDRRVRKTKTRLLNCLTELMKEKEVKDISVKELSDLADINRGTFYLHYRDVYDMLNKVEDELFSEFNKILDRDFTTVPDDTLYTILEDVFTFLYANVQTAQALMGPHGDLTFINRMKEVVKQRILQVWRKNQQPSETFDYYYSFLVSGCIGMIEAWLNKETPEPPRQIAALAGDLIKRGFITPVF